MPQLTVEDAGTFDVPDGKRLVLALTDEAKIDQLHACGGVGRCTTCRVTFVSGEPQKMTEAERAILTERGLIDTPGLRLSCQLDLRRRHDPPRREPPVRQQPQGRRQAPRRRHPARAGVGDAVNGESPSPVLQSGPMAEDPPWTVKRLLEWTVAFFGRRGVEPGRLSAELLLGHVLSLPRIKLYTDYLRPLSPDELNAFRGLVKRAAEQEPVAYLIGKSPFFNVELVVTRDVLIPRPDTEVLVEHVLQQFRLRPGLEMPRVLDLCTGSGAIACAVAHHHKRTTAVAADVSEKAVEVARRNVEQLGLSDRVAVARGDLYAALDGLPDAGPFDMILANPPYIPSGRIASLDRSVRDYEPRLALDGGDDGLDPHRRILAGAPGRLNAGGRVYLEIDDGQADAARTAADEVGAFEDVRILKDSAGQDRVLTAALK